PRIESPAGRKAASRYTNPAAPLNRQVPMVGWTAMIRDITRTLTHGFPTWPGDPGFSLDRVSSLETGRSCDVTRITMSAHAGTHPDAPSHVLAGAGDLSTIDLDPLVGPALVVHVPGKRAIPVETLRAAIQSADGADQSPGTVRLLIRTNSAPADPASGRN